MKKRKFTSQNTYRRGRLLDTQQSKVIRYSTHSKQKNCTAAEQEVSH